MNENIEKLKNIEIGLQSLRLIKYSRGLDEYNNAYYEKMKNERNELYREINSQSKTKILKKETA